MRSTDHKAPRYVVLSTPGLSRTLGYTDGVSLLLCRKISYTDFSALLLTAHHSHHSVTTKRARLTPYRLESTIGITLPEQKPQAYTFHRKDRVPVS